MPNEIALKAGIRDFSLEIFTTVYWSGVVNQLKL